MYTIWVTDDRLEEGGELFVNRQGKVFLFKTEDDAEKVREALDWDVDRPMKVQEAHPLQVEHGEVYRGKLLE